MKKSLSLLALSLALGCAFSAPATAASTDVVPRGSVLLDSFASLARANAFGAANTPEDFLGEPLYTRGQLAQLLERLVLDEPARLAAVEKDDAANTALHEAIQGLQSEIDRDGADLSVAATPPAASSAGGYVQPELRVRAGGDHRPGSGGIGVYRATAQGSLSSNLRYAVSASNWFEDRRRVFDNDKGPHDFSAVSEAFLALDGGRGLTVDLGRMNNRWGPGYRGAVMLSDNAPAMDQIRVAFPFSLGSRLGRDYRFTQFLGRFTEDHQTKYFAGRRIELAVTPRLTADFQESFKTNRSRALAISFLPDFYTGKNANLGGKIHVRDLEDFYNAVLAAGLSYQFDPDTRLYGQFAVDDLRTPGKSSGVTPRKIAYLVGFAAQPLAHTGVVAEYSFADPTTYTFHTLENQWQKGQFDEIGLPAGPNSQEVFLRLSQRLSPLLSVSLQGRDRRRHDNSFPEPRSRDIAATVEFAPDHHSGIEVSYHDYRQDPFPLAPDVPVGNGFQPSNAEGNYGQNLRIKQVDVSYRFFF